MIRIFTTVFTVACLSSVVLAKGGGGEMHFGGNFGLLTTSQDDLNTLRNRDNTRWSPVSTNQLGSAYEVGASFGYRFSGTIWEVMFRPSYFWQGESGSGAGNRAVEYKLSGFTLFPMLRLYPLENQLMKFFFQFGVGYGRVSGKIVEDTYNVEYAGGSFGYVGGLGVEICITDSHCFGIEGNVRGLPFEKLLVTSASGSLPAGPAGISQGTAVGEELEMDTRDVKVSGSGIQALLGYVMRF